MVADQHGRDTSADRRRLTAQATHQWSELAVGGHLRDRSGPLRRGRLQSIRQGVCADGLELTRVSAQDQVTCTYRYRDQPVTFPCPECTWTKSFFQPAFLNR